MVNAAGAAVAAATTTTMPPPTAGAAAESAAMARAAGARAAEAGAGRGGGGTPRTVTVDADLLEQIAKRVDILAEAFRRDGERARMCRGCGGEADYLAVYGGKDAAADEARVCEKCMKDDVRRRHGVEFHVWQQDLTKLTCLRCGDDITVRGWCVCPRNAGHARAGAAAEARAARGGGGA